ncbi:MAG: PIN domain-containing protein [Candidatus Thiosymbion ectosymbiont of Robbea hypermnestra]|nr:PIN domain-containing protein [Candidatus Thiosymbion ectosymbiont of Robbea hypermnestra]
MRNTVLVDTGFLVALFDGTDPLHASAKKLLADKLHPHGANLVTVWPTIVETCFFLDARGKSALLEWVRRGAMRLRHIETPDLPVLSGILEKYADQKIDLADACMIWLSGVERTNRILTTDRRDFQILRTLSGKQFDRIWVTP